MPTFSTPQPITATLTTAGARVRIAASVRTDTVVRVEPVDATNTRDVRVAERTKVGFIDGVLAIKTTKSGTREGSVAIAVELPAGSRLVLNTAWTGVSADGQLGDCELNVGSGQVELDRVAALRGSVATGAVAVWHVAGPVDVQGGSEELWVGEVDDVVRYEGSGGAVTIAHAHSDVTVRAANCPIRIGRVTRGLVEVVNSAGGIEIGVGEGSTAEVDARSTKGLVRNSVPVRERTGDSVKVHARTRLDDIVIRPAS